MRVRLKYTLNNWQIYLSSGEWFVCLFVCLFVSITKMDKKNLVGDYAL